MKKKMFIPVLIGLLALFGGVQAADKIAPIQLSLKEAVQKALVQNHTVQVVKLKINEQASVTEQAKSGYLPQVSVVASQARERLNYTSSGFSGSGFPSSNTFNSFQAYVQISQTVFDLSLIKSIAIAREQEKFAKADYAAAKEAMTLKVVSLYLQTLQSNARVKATQALLAAGKALLTQAKQFEDAGTGSKLETARADLEYQNEVQTLSEASTDYENAKLALAQLINLEQGRPLELTDTAQFEQVENISVDSAIQEAKSLRPDFISALTREKALQLNIEQAQAQHAPVVGVTGQLSRTGSDPGNNDNAYFIGGTVTIPVFTGGNIQGQIEQAKSQLEQQRETTKELESQIELEIRTAVNSLNAAVDQVLSAKQGVESSEVTLRLTRSRYTEGISTNVEVVNAQDTLARAQENEIRALYNFNLAKANLAKGMGKIQDLYSPEK